MKTGPKPTDEEVHCKSPFCNDTNKTCGRYFILRQRICLRCYNQLKRYGRFNIARSTVKPCKNPNRDITNKTPKSHFQHGHCGRCWDLFKRNGTYERVTCINEGKTCKEPGCDLPAYSKLMCSHHFEQSRKDDPKRREQNLKYTRSAEGKAKRHAFDISPAGRESSRKSEAKRSKDPVKMQIRRDQAKSRHQKNPQINREKDKKRYNTPKRRESIYQSLKRQDETNAKKHGLTVVDYKWRRTNWAEIIKIDQCDLECKVCLKKLTSKELNAHHLLFKSLYRGLEFNKTNGIALCKECHKEVHSLNGIGVKNRKHFILTA